MNRQLKVKKLYSMNPFRYKMMTLADASDEYAEYLANVLNNATSKDKIVFKTFTNWLETEI